MCVFRRFDDLYPLLLLQWVEFGVFCCFSRRRGIRKKRRSRGFIRTGLGAVRVLGVGELSFSEMKALLSDFFLEAVLTAVEAKLDPATGMVP